MNRSRHRIRWILVLSAIATVILWEVPYGRWIGYPLFLLSTVAHELGHGFTAMLLGGHFVAFLMWPDGSGVAQWQGNFGRAARALVAAGGLLGPAVAAAVLFFAGTKPERARWSLGVLGLFFLVVTLVFVRTLFGLLFVSLLAILCAVIAVKATAEGAQIVVLFLGVQLALAVFSRADYLFTAEAVTGAGRAPSDVAVMAQALWLPFWIWGLLCAALSLLVLGWGLGRAWNR